MIKLALLTLVSATTLTNGATQAFNAAQIGVAQTISVYTAAGKIFDTTTDTAALNKANANLQAAGAQLEGWSDYYAQTATAEAVTKNNEAHMYAAGTQLEGWNDYYGQTN